MNKKLTDHYIKPDFKKCAVITIDVQNDFSLPGAVAEIKGTYEVLPKINTILHACRKNKLPVIHAIRLYKADGSNADLCRKKMIESGTEIVRPNSLGADLVQPVKPKEAGELNYQTLLNGNIQLIGNLEWVMYKPRWGAFYQTKLEGFLKEKEINTLIFTGCNFPNCPRTSIYEASERDFRVVLVEDAVSGIYDKAITELNNIGVMVCTSNQLIKNMEAF